MELNNQRNSACYMPSMDEMRVAVYLLYNMHVLYIWAVARCCACFAAADSGPNAALYAVDAWTPAASIFLALEHVVRVILIFVPQTCLFPPCYCCAVLFASHPCTLLAPGFLP